MISFANESSITQASLPKKTTVEAEDNSSAPESKLKPIDSAIVLENTLRKAQDILWGALPPRTSREPTIVKLKELLWSPEISSALAASSDNYFAFAVRESRVALADASAWPDKIVSTLWAILDDPPLHAALGIPQNSRMKNHPRRNHRWR